ncbi:solute carrier family 23 member 2-like [Haliotis rufescens]|uniref:solute carrier family 23 member 2-like n=1 Tax=Haliotis rufescens TaxID=6454 RepID=UPI00201F78A4|nr:solute carrier family 23 member 2-like [Haliotis rufescens]
MQIEETDDEVEQIPDNGNALETTLRYTLAKPPPLSITITAALQHILMCIPASLAIPFIVADGICAEYDSPIRTTLFSSSLFMCGVCTILQTALGVRLPILQGPSSVFLPVILAVQKSDSWKCVDSVHVTAPMYGNNTTTSPNMSSATTNPILLTQDEKLQQLSGSIMAASLVEILIGGTGLVGRLLRFVGPITVAPTIALIGLSLYKIPIRYSKSSWELSLTGSVLVVVFALYLGHVKIPVPTRANCKNRGKSNGKLRGVRLFQLLPVLMSILAVWAISGILTYTNVFPSDPDHPRFRARADAKSKLIHMSPWFYLPYPGQFGLPSFNLALCIGFMATFFASLIESVGDYYAAAKACSLQRG